MDRYLHKTNNLTKSKGYGGESGIRTHGTVLPYTRFPSVRLKPLGHLSGAHVLPVGAGFFKGKARFSKVNYDPMESRTIQFFLYTSIC